ncbi:MAG: ATP-binding cassette domain-containing protein [Cyanobacteria bacterium J06623_4]
MRQYLSKVLYVLSGKRQQLAAMMLLFIFVSILEVLGIGLIGPFLSIVSDPSIVRTVPLLGPVVAMLGLESDREIIALSALLVMSVYCFKSVTYYLCKASIYRFSYQQKQELESRLVYTYLNISYLFHLNRNSATLIKNLAIESTQFTVNCLIPLLEILANILVVILLLGLLAVTDVYLVLMVLAVLLPVFLLFGRLSRRIRKWGKTKSNAQANMIRAVNHGLGGLKETKVLGCEAYFEGDLRRYSKQCAEASMRFDSFQLIPRIAIETVLVVFLLMFVLIAQLFLNRSLEELTAVMGVFAVASIRMIPAASQILHAMGRMRSMSYALDMLYRDLKEIENYTVPSGALSEPTFRPVTTRFDETVSLQKVTFSYPNADSPALKDISLDIRKGESIALVGKSGSGKTTLVDIILGLLQPSSGDILLDGQSVYKDLRAWQNLLGYIPQSIFLTDETIAQNIAFGIPEDEIDYDRVEMAVRAAQLQDLVDQLPAGLETMVGERGTRISGGQRQRVGIARALYYGREILVLDEATSALDSETEKLVSDAIASLAGNKTLIIIAHRLSTIEHCDRIYRLDSGQIQQTGTYQEVVLATNRR